MTGGRSCTYLGIGYEERLILDIYFMHIIQPSQCINGTVLHALCFNSSGDIRRRTLLPGSPEEGRVVN